MKEWLDLLATGDITTILIVIVLVLLTGGAGAAIVTTWGASRRGIRGDALVKEKNGIDGLSTLADKQGKYIETLEARVERAEIEFEEKLESARQEFDDRLSVLEDALHSELAYSNLLISTLSENTIPIPPRPIIK